MYQTDQLGNRNQRLKCAGFAYSWICGLLLLLGIFVPLLLPDDQLFQVLANQAAIVIIALVFAQRTGNPLKHTLRLKAPRLSEALLSVLSALLFLPASLMLAAVMLIIVELLFGSIAISSALTDYLNNPLITIGLLSLVPAICEELAFRGVILRGLEAKFKPATAIVLTGVLFGLVHMDFQRFISQMLVGIMAGYVVYRSKSIFCGMLVHFTNNAVAFLISAFSSTAVLASTGGAGDSMSMIDLFTQAGQEVGIDGSTMLIFSIVLFLIIAAVFTGLTMIVLFAFHKVTRKKHVQSNPEIDVPLPEPETFQSRPLPYSQENPHEPLPDPTPRNSAMLTFLPGVIIIAIMYILTALVLKML